MYTPVNPSFTIFKWRVRGSSLHGLVFVMKSNNKVPSLLFRSEKVRHTKTVFFVYIVNSEVHIHALVLVGGFLPAFDFFMTFIRKKKKQYCSLA